MEVSLLLVTCWSNYYTMTFPGSDSDGEEGEDDVCLSGTNFEHFYFDEEEIWRHFSGKCCYSECAIYLLIARQT